MAAFQDQLKRTITKKIENHQRAVDKPFILIIRTRLDLDWQYEYETDINDLLITKEVIKDAIRDNSEISGVIITIQS